MKTQFIINTHSVRKIQMLKAATRYYQEQEVCLITDANSADFS